ncbi:TRAP transporter substrate-binding protein DctP [uncultured Sphaerochaeta sp.]|uniref:TRAP transporter substrate-binding protein DctP n=1 Tax=uncultured Sphaerochaeta sp. TaxID=886478 RepID=UPI002A0A7D40|nr:TRAP transporter substrate-binding protein DctP [uncultured Sphaerochaeta sp.]
MYLTHNDVQTTISLLQATFDIPTALVDLQWNILGLTQMQASTQLQKIIRYCASSENPTQIARDMLATLFTFSYQRKTICHILLLKANAEAYCQFIASLLTLHMQSHVEVVPNHPFNIRTMLVNQLANTSGTNPEIATFLSELGYTEETPRCAILLFLSYPESLPTKFDLNFLETSYTQMMQDSDLFSKEDIYGPLNADQFIIYKQVESLQFPFYKEKIVSFVAYLKTMFLQHYGITIQATAGTPYTQLTSLKQSYKEAMFLQSNFAYLYTREEPCIFLDQNIFEYLTSLLPHSYLKTRFKPFDHLLQENPACRETLLALTKRNTNLVCCAKELCLHRNTVLQRFTKLKSLLDINPLYHDKDRLILRSYALYQNKRIDLHVGIIIQPNSVLHQGMQKMAEVIAKKSGDNMVLNIHTISTSGDNHMLFELLCQGSLDVVVVASSALNNATNNRSALLELPFLFDSYEEARQLMKDLIIPELDGPLVAIGAKCLGLWSMGWRYITSRDAPIQRPYDMQGKKMRIMYNDTMTEYFKNLGTIPIQMNYGDVAKSLETGIIDCQENPYSNILEMQFYQYQKYITLLKFHLSTEACLISQQTWTKLSEPQRAIIISAMEETTEWIYREQQIFNAQCCNTLVEEKGMELVDVSHQQELEWRAFAKELYVDTSNQDLLKKIIRAKKADHAKKQSRYIL